MAHGSRRRYYLEDVPLEEALSRYVGILEEAGALGPTEAEEVPLEAALGRITAVPVWARRSSPHYDSAAMDGIAVRSRDTAGATETRPLRLKLGEQAHWVDTGDPMPVEADAVIMVEHVHVVDDETVEIRSPAAPYQHVRPLGEDVVATELVLPQGHLLRPVDLGACAAAGVASVQVRRRPAVAVIPTGSELVPIEASPAPGQITEFNSLVLASMLTEWGAQVHRLPPVPDRREELAHALRRAAGQYNLVVINAGSSAGSEDYTAPVVEELGRLVVHGVAVRPGHPVVLGLVQGTPVLGIPGYPVSAVLTCELFVKPLIERKLAYRFPERPTLEAVMARKVSSPMGEDEFLRVRLGQVGERTVATPVQRGAGVITSMVRADGLVRIPRFSEGLEAGQRVQVELLRPLREVRDSIVATGSHDLTLDLLASRLQTREPYRRLVSSNVGSLGGLLALARGEAHLAGSHLLDPDTGEYNVPYVRRYLRGLPVVLVHLVGRIQGLIVPKGNPKGLSSVEDLARGDVSFVNRQRGSGTRLLLDHLLSRRGIDPGSIRGYQREEYTHLAVAAAVAGGRADVGLGILSAARALDLDFVPVAPERYDLVVPLEHYRGDLLRPLLAEIRSEGFRRAVADLGGYDVSHTGEEVARLGDTRG